MIDPPRIDDVNLDLVKVLYNFFILAALLVFLPLPLISSVWGVTLINIPAATIVRALFPAKHCEPQTWPLFILGRLLLLLVTTSPSPLGSKPSRVRRIRSGIRPVVFNAVIRKLRMELEQRKRGKMKC